MQATVERAEALRLLRIEHESVREIIDALNPAQMIRPDTIEYGLYHDQECSFKDLLAHLITYEAYTLEAIDAWASGESHWVSAAMRDPAQSRDIHYGGIADRADDSLDTVLAEWERTAHGLEEAIAGLSDAEWRAPAPFPTAEPTDLGGMIEGIMVVGPRPMYRHLPVHVPDSDAYIAKLRAHH